MKIKVDEDLPKKLVEMVGEVIPDTTSVIGERISGASDQELWERVQAEGRFLITGDKGFADIRKHPPGHHHGVLLLRPDNPCIPEFIALIRHVLELNVIRDLGGSIAVVSPKGLRVRRGKGMASPGEGSL